MIAIGYAEGTSVGYSHATALLGISGYNTSYGDESKNITSCLIQNQDYPLGVWADAKPMKYKGKVTEAIELIHVFDRFFAIKIFTLKKKSLTEKKKTSLELEFKYIMGGEKDEDKKKEIKKEAGLQVQKKRARKNKGALSSRKAKAMRKQKYEQCEIK